MENQRFGKRQFEKRHSLPYIDEDSILVLQAVPVPRLKNRRASVAIGESSLQLQNLHLKSQQSYPHAPTKRRGSDFSIGTQRRLSRASLDSRITALDGGYGWVVVVACFVTTFLCLGFCFSFAVFYVEFLDVFNESKSLTSWIGSILNSMSFFMAPIASALAAKYWVRAVGYIGCLISVCALTVSMFCTSVVLLMVFMGFFTGMGLGLMYMVGYIPPAYYFDKRQSLAMGIVSCGGGAAFMIFPLFSEWLIEMYGWRGALLLTAGSILHCLPAFMLMRPVNKIRSSLLKKGNMHGKGGNQRRGFISTEAMSLQDMIEGSIEQDTDEFPECFAKDETPAAPQFHITKSKHKENGCQVENNSLPNIDRRVDGSSPDQDVVSSVTASDGSICNMDKHSKENAEKFEDKSLPDAQSKIKPRHQKVQQFLDYIDVTFLWNPIFVLFSIVCAFSSAGLSITVTFLTDYGISIGMTPKLATMMFVIIGVTSSTTRILVGKLVDYPKADPFVVNGIFLLLCGVATLLMSLTKLQPVMATYAAILGIMTGIYGVLTPVLVVDLVGVDHMGSAMSLSVCISAVFILVAVPVAGWLYDFTLSYTPSFSLAGAFFLAAGVMSLMLRCAARCIFKNREPT